MTSSSPFAIQRRTDRSDELVSSAISATVRIGSMKDRLASLRFIVGYRRLTQLIDSLELWRPALLPPRLARSLPRAAAANSNRVAVP
jgi:hypothetical protein